MEHNGREEEGRISAFLVQQNRVVDSLPERKLLKKNFCKDFTFGALDSKEPKVEKELARFALPGLKMPEISRN